MTYADIIVGLHERFATVPGLVNILAYVPTAIHDVPTLYTLTGEGEISESAQVRTVVHRIEHRICFRWQDNERAEVELRPFIGAIPAAVRADPYLGGRLTRGGHARIVRYQADWREHGGTLYRTLEFTSEVVMREVT